MKRSALKVTGYTVNSGDDEEMAARIMDLLNKPERARAMGERGKLIAAGKFSCDRHLQNTLELYDELLSTPKVCPLTDWPRMATERIENTGAAQFVNKAVKARAHEKAKRRRLVLLIALLTAVVVWPMIAWAAAQSSDSQIRIGFS